MALGNLIFLLLAGVGMTTIIVEGEIFVPVKNFLEKFMPKFFMKMLNCHQCCGFWSGFLLSMIFLPPVVSFSTLSIWQIFGELLLKLGHNFAAGCAVSLLAVFWAIFAMFLESKTSVNQ